MDHSGLTTFGEVGGVNPIRSAISGGADDVAEFPVVGTDVSTTDRMAGDGMAGDGEFATSRMLACADIAFDMALN